MLLFDILNVDNSLNILKNETLEHWILIQSGRKKPESAIKI